MDITEWIGFFISIGAVLFLLLRLASENAKRRKDPKAYDQQQRHKEREMRKLLKSLEIDADDEEDDEEIEEPIPPPKPIQKQSLGPKISQFSVTGLKTPQPNLTQSFKRPSKQAVPQMRPDTPSRGKLIVKKIGVKEMVILRELIGPPKSMRKLTWHHYWD